ncbi:soluble lytic murein transglycosylase [Alphaproteobacteria bacterium]
MPYPSSVCLKLFAYIAVMLSLYACSITIAWSHTPKIPPNAIVSALHSPTRDDVAQIKNLEHTAGKSTNIKAILQFIHNSNRYVDNLPSIINIMRNNKLLLHVFGAQIEAKMSYKMDKQHILDWFMLRPPEYKRASILLCDTILRANPLGYATTEKMAAIRTKLEALWINTTLPLETEEYLQNFHKFPIKCLKQKIQYLLFSGEYSLVQFFLTFLPSADKKSVNFKLKFANSPELAFTKIKNDPKLQQDDFINFISIKYLLKIGEINTAVNKLANKKQKIYQELWWKIAKLGIREALKINIYDKAFKIAVNYTSSKELTTSEVVDSSWLAGFLALHFLHNYEQAILHLKKMYDTAQYSLSKSQAAYWLGVTYKKFKNKEKEQYWFNVAKSYGTFYSYLVHFDDIKTHQLNATTLITRKNQGQKHIDSTIQEAVFTLQLLHEAGYDPYVEKIYNFLAKSNLTIGDNNIIAQHLVDNDELALAVNFSNTLLKFGYNIAAPTYNISKFSIPPTSKYTKSLYFAIMRQESAFYDKAISQAGAKGLMQIMPATAKMIANQMGLAADFNIMAPDANIAIGVHYLDSLIEEFDSFILGIASYNAGKNNVAKWINMYPQTPKNSKKPEDIVAWIELMPFKETRLYVKKVLENLWTYELFKTNITANKLLRFLY